ncbi:hypothetical protein Syun_027388 [Stephania yunnanensis]|uniref:Uncharacterized protein n=1 Tax=Stephania yunnanensis TaxID=152371 RepID=A0AAP0EKL2_9MAGN
MGKLGSMKEKIKCWNQNVFGVTKVQKADLKEIIRQIDENEGGPEWDSQMGEQRTKNKSEFDRVLLIKNRIACQKLRVTWAKEGNSNTKFFSSDSGSSEV